jgi:hypothetical protein
MKVGWCKLKNYVFNGFRCSHGSFASELTFIASPISKIPADVNGKVKVERGFLRDIVDLRGIRYFEHGGDVFGCVLLYFGMNAFEFRHSQLSFHSRSRLTQLIGECT